MWMWVVVIASAIWVLIDAKSIGVKKGVVTGMGNMGPVAWFLATLLLWIVAFPMYLYYRGKFKQALGTAGATTPVSDSVEQLEKLAALKEKGFISDEEFHKKKRELL